LYYPLHLTVSKPATPRHFRLENLFSRELAKGLFYMVRHHGGPFTAERNVLWPSYQQKQWIITMRCSG